MAIFKVSLFEATYSVIKSETKFLKRIYAFVVVSSWVGVAIILIRNVDNKASF